MQNETITPQPVRRPIDGQAEKEQKRKTKTEESRHETDGIVDQVKTVKQKRKAQGNGSEQLRGVDHGLGDSGFRFSSRVLGQLAGKDEKGGRLGDTGLESDLLAHIDESGAFPAETVEEI